MCLANVWPYPGRQLNICSLCGHTGRTKLLLPLLSTANVTGAFNDPPKRKFHKPSTPKAARKNLFQPIKHLKPQTPKHQKSHKENRPSNPKPPKETLPRPSGSAEAYLKVLSVLRVDALSSGFKLWGYIRGFGGFRAWV